MGPWLAPILSIGAHLLSGLFGNRQAAVQRKAANEAARRNMLRQQEAAREDAARANAAAKVTADRANEAAANPILIPAAGVDFAKLRADAINGGYNPLTALGATGGQGYANSYADRAYAPESFAQQAYYGEAVSAPASVLANGFAAVSDIANSQYQHQLDMSINAAQYAQESALQQQRLKAEADLYKAMPGSSVLPQDNPVTGDIVVYTPAGKKQLMPASTAARLGYKDGDILTSGDYESIYGTAGMIPSVISSVGGFLFGGLNPLRDPPVAVAPPGRVTYSAPQLEGQWMLPTGPYSVKVPSKSAAPVTNYDPFSYNLDAMGN